MPLTHLPLHVPADQRRATLALLPLGAFETAPDGSWEFVTPRLLAMLGDLPLSSMKGREWLKRIHPDDLQRVIAEYRQARNFGRPWEQQFRLLNSDGYPVPIGVDAIPLPGVGERGTRYIGLVRDRTNYVRAYEHGAETRRLFEQLLDASSEGVLINRVDVTVAANRAAAQILGWETGEELIGNRGIDRIHPDDIERLMEAAHSQEDRVTTAKFLRKNGTWVDVAVRGRPITYEGAPARLVTFIPLSDPMVASAIAARSALQLHTLESLVHSPYHRIAIDGPDAGRILSTNAEFASLLGRTVAEVVGMHFIEFTHPDDIAVSQNAFQDFTAHEGTSSTHLRKRLIAKDGSTVLVDLDSAAYRDPLTGRLEGMTFTTPVQE